MRFWHKCFAGRKVDRSIGKIIFDVEEKVGRSPGVGYANFSKPFVLEMLVMLGLGQYCGGLQRPIAYASRGLHPAE